MHVTYWIHPDMNCNRFHIHCVCLWVPYQRGLFFTPPPFSFPHNPFSPFSPSLPLSPPLRTCLTLCLMCMHLRFVVIEGVLQCKLLLPVRSILKVVYTLCTYIIHTVEPLCNLCAPELKTKQDTFPTYISNSTNILSNWWSQG